MRRILTVAAAILLAVTSLPEVHAQNTATTILPADAAVPSQTAVTIRPTTSVTGAPGWSATVVMQFPYSGTNISAWGTPMRQGSAITLDFTAVKPLTANTLPSTVTREASLGALDPGTYTFTVTTRGLTLANSTFTIGSALPVVQNVTLAVNTANTSDVRAAVHVDFGGYYSVRSQSPVTKDATGRFVLDATVDPVAVPQAAPMPAFPKFDFLYALGAVNPGTYAVVFRMNGTTFKEATFTINPPPPPTIHLLSLQAGVPVPGGPARAVAQVSVPSTSPPLVWTGSVSEGANVFSGAVSFDTAAAAPAAGTISTMRTETHEFPLGTLPAGSYGFVLRSGTVALGQVPFQVAPTPATDPRLVSMGVQVAATGRFGIVTLAVPATQPAVAWGQIVRDGLALTADASYSTTVPPASAAGTLERMETFSYPLTATEPGTYAFVFKFASRELARRPFVISAPPPPPQPSLAFAEARMNTAAGGYVLEVGILVPQAGRTITNWGALSADGRTFRASMTTGDVVVTPPVAGEEMAGDPVFQSQGFVVAAGDPTPGGVVPIMVARHTYPLPAIEPGECAFEATVDGKPAGKRNFVIAPLPPPPLPVVGAMEISKTAAGSWNAKVTVILPKPDQLVADWGSVTATGNSLSAGITIGTAVVPAGADPVSTVAPDIAANGGAVLPAPRPVFTHSYDLGTLADGDYSFALRLGDKQLAVRFFRVSATPPPPPPIGPRLAFIEIKQGDASTAAEVGILLPPGRTVTGWGDVAKDGNTLKVTATVGLSTVAANTASVLALVERHVYSLGTLDAGEYKLTVCWQDATATIPPAVLGARTFQIGATPPLPPGPGRLPLVAFLEAGKDSAGSFVDLGLVFPSPGQEVKNWGTPVRDGSAFKTALTLGPVDPNQTPVVAPAPAAVAADGGVVNVRLGEPLPSATGPTAPVELGGWPVKPVVHRYPLGQLAAGQYTFAVCLGDKVLARRTFWVRPPALVPPPVATVRVEPIRAAKAAAHPFRITFTAAAGWQGDPTLAKVTVAAPNGTTTEATRVSGGIVSTDALGRLAEAIYTVAAPGTGWDSAANGLYKICLDLSAVKDNQGRTLAEPCVGGFSVNIAPLPPIPPTELKAEISVTMLDGKWQAAVSFENTGNWFQADWNTVKVLGTSFLAYARLSPLPTGSLAPIPASFSHTYDLGELKPGSYLFVFRSSAGHAARATVDVAGVEPPTALDQWKFNVFGAAYIDSGAAGDLDDPDKSGVPTLVQFALGGDPARGVRPEIKPGIVMENGVPKLALHFRRPAGSRPSADCQIEVSADMVHWFPAGDTVDLKPSVFDIDGSEAVCALQKSPLGVSQWPFMRIRVVHTPSN